MHHDTPTIPFMRMRRHVPAVLEVEMTHQQQKVEEVKPLVDSNKEVQSLQLWGSHYLSLWLAPVVPNFPTTENMLPSDNLGPILNKLHFHDVCHLPLYLANSFLLGPRHNEN
jgi:hypothetical protein